MRDQLMNSAAIIEGRICDGKAQRGKQKTAGGEDSLLFAARRFLSLLLGGY